MLITSDKIQLSIREWDCYDNRIRRTPQEVVDTINSEFSEILGSSRSPVYAQQRIYDVLGKYSIYGFSDSECHQVATNVINLYYKSNIDRWEFLTIS